MFCPDWRKLLIDWVINFPEGFLAFLPWLLQWLLAMLYWLFPCFMGSGLERYDVLYAAEGYFIHRSVHLLPIANRRPGSDA